MGEISEHMKHSAGRFAGLARFRYALRNFLASSEQICRQGGVTTTQYQAMLALACAAELFSIKHLAEQLLLKHHSAVQLVDRLSAAGLVDRVVSGRDARVVLVSLTPKGAAKFEALAELHLAEMLRREPQLSSALQLLRKQGNRG
jgi:DNA-binding MarR family transcriptional regulator